jgi:hypothetical protein
MPATLFFLRQPPAPRRLGDIGPSPAFWQVKSTQCLFRARHKQHKDQSTRFLARESSLSVKSTRTIRRRQYNTKTNQLAFWRGEFFGRQGSDNNPTAAMVMTNNPSNKYFTAIIVRLYFLGVDNPKQGKSTMKHSMFHTQDSTPGTSLREL